ncbi:DNA replication licensing factor mcm7 [Apiospora arundinis]
MRTLAAFPFGPSTLEQQASLSDEDAAAFRYEPHVLCPACRELLTLAIELQRQRGAQLSEYIETAYHFGQLCGSAKLGCHMCALLEAAMWTRPKDIVEGEESHMWSWKVAFALLPATDPDALLLITIECSGAGSMRGYSLPVFPINGAGSVPDIIPAKTPKPSLGMNTGDEATFDIAQTWLQRCLKEHIMCAENDDEARIERYSAPRTLLYGANGIYWECRCAQASEAHYCDVAWDDESNKKTWLQRLEVGDTSALQQSGWDTKQDSKVITWKDHWIGLLKAYSSCELTVKSDKIIAVTGLISEIERRSKVRPRCILGLWDYDLPGMALWYRSRDSMNSDIDFVGRLKNNMPTWTWASVEGRCSYLLSGGEIEWQAAVSIDESTLPATMSIKTWCRKVLLDEDDAIQLDPDDPKTGQRGWGGDLDETYSWFPDSEMPEAETRSALFVVPMQRVRISSGLWVARCLVLTTCIKEVGVYTRVGVVLIRYSDKRDDPFKSKDDKAQEMILLR